MIDIYEEWIGNCAKYWTKAVINVMDWIKRLLCQKVKKKRGTQDRGIWKVHEN